MSKKIGERLIEKRLLTPAQLDKALKAQLIFGGHVGTSLIELGFVDEEVLSSTLAEIHRVDQATAEMLEQIEPSVLGLVGVKLVEKYKIVPLKVVESTLHLAVVDPRSIPTLSSVKAFKKIRKIVPWVAPEIRVLQAMEKYYGIPRRPRYLNICHELERGQPSEPSAADPIVVSEPSTVVSSPVAAEVAPRQTVNMEDIGEEYGYGRSWKEIAGEIFDGNAVSSSPGARRDTADAETGAVTTDGPVDLEEVGRRLSQAGSKDELAGAVFDYLARRTSGSILFSVQSEVARVWDWRGVALSRERIGSVRFPVTSGSIFTLLLGNEYYRGPVKDDAGCQLFYGSLQVDVPAEVLLLPVYLSDRLVAILYADGGKSGTIRGRIDDYLRLANKLSLAFKMIILKGKIISS